MKFLNKILLTAMFLTSLGLQADEYDPQPYSSIRNLPPTPYFVQDAYIYYSLIQSHNAAIIIDVESDEGGVARFIAQQANNLPSVNTIYAVNAWTSCDPSQKYLFQRFLSNVKQENTTNLIVPIRMNSNDAALALNVKADFISIVGGNDAETIYKDILSWYPHLSDDGVICGNNWNDNSVEIGVTKAAESLDLTLKINDNVWYFEKNNL